MTEAPKPHKLTLQAAQDGGYVVTDAVYPTPVFAGELDACLRYVANAFEPEPRPQRQAGFAPIIRPVSWQLKGDA